MKLKTKVQAIVAGNIGVDISPVFTGQPKGTVGDWLKPGKIVNIEGSEIHPGGAVANTGIAMNMFGTKTTLLGVVGEDNLGQMLEEMVIDHQAPAVLLRDKSTYTAYSIILAMAGLDRIILQNPGANHRFSLEHLEEIYKSNQDLFNGASIFHFGHPPSMKMTYVNNGEGLAQIFKWAKEKGLVTSLDMCAVDPEAESGKEDWYQVLTKTLPYVDFFMPSMEEIIYMMKDKVPEVDQIGEDVSRNREAIWKLMDRAKDLGATNVILKSGKDGMYYKTGNQEAFRKIEESLGFEPRGMEGWANKEGHRKAFEIKEEVSGLGAGDTAIAGFLAAMSQGYSLEDTLTLAVGEGARCVTGHDAFSGLVDFDEILNK